MALKINRFQYHCLMFLVIYYLRYITIKWHAVTSLKHVSLLKISYSCGTPMTLCSSYAIEMTDQSVTFSYFSNVYQNNEVKKVVVLACIPWIVLISQRVSSPRVTLTLFWIVHNSNKTFHAFHNPAIRYAGSTMWIQLSYSFWTSREFGEQLYFPDSRLNT